MEMCNREDDRCTDVIGERPRSDMEKYRLRLFNCLIRVYEITQVDNENNWLFEWNENNVLNKPKQWKKVFIQSFNSDFDFNSRWLYILKQLLTAPAKNKTKEKSKNISVKKNKKELPLIRNFKGGQKEMRRSKRMFEKARRKEKRKIISRGFTEINLGVE